MEINIKLSREENINHFGSSEITIDIEEYLKGVVPSEIGNAPVEACAAQAVAARTFAANAVKNKGYITDKSNIDQAFRASRMVGYPNAYKGIEKTAGQLLYYNNKIAKCFYSNSNGGRTTSAKDRWGGTDYPYLIEQDDPYDNGNGGGHGVGLSQIGAKNRAAAGHTYQEILSFYFPGITLVKQEENSMTENEKKIYDWLQKRPSEGYVWGSTGYILTEAKLDALIKQYPQYVSYEKNGKWLGKRVWDCAQLVRYAMKEVGISMVSGATSQWKKTDWEERGTIDTLPKDKICCLYRQTPDQVMQHTGVYTADGYFIDARGSSSGVLKTKLSTTTYKWTHWGIPRGLYTSKKDEEVYEVLYKAIVSADNGNTVNMRTSPSTKASIIAKIPVGTPVDVLEEQGEWNKIGCDGKVGYMMAKYLKKEDASQPEEEKTFYVKIKCSNASEAKRLVELLGKAVAE